MINQQAVKIRARIDIGRHVTGNRVKAVIGQGSGRHIPAPNADRKVTCASFNALIYAGGAWVAARRRMAPDIVGAVRKKSRKVVSRVSATRAPRVGDSSA